MNPKVDGSLVAFAVAIIAAIIIAMLVR